MSGVRQAELFQRDGNLAAVRRRPGVKIDHGIGPVFDCKYSNTPSYAALFLPQSRAEAISAPSRIDLSLSQTAGSITHSRRVNVPKPQSVEAMTRSRSPTAATASSMRRATTSGCSTKFEVVSTTAGMRIMSFGNGTRLSAAYSWACRGLENSIDSAPTLAW